MEMNRPGAWVGNHSSSAEQGRSQDGGWSAPASSLICQFSPSRRPSSIPAAQVPSRTSRVPHAHWPAQVLMLLQTGPGLTAGRRVAVVLSLVSSPDVAELASMRQAGLSQRLSPGATVRPRHGMRLVPQATGHRPQGHRATRPQGPSYRAVVQDVHVSALGNAVCAHADADAVVWQLSRFHLETGQGPMGHVVTMAAHLPQPPPQTAYRAQLLSLLARTKNARSTRW